MMLKLFRNPEKKTWPELCRRPLLNREGLQQTVAGIIAEVRNNGDAALKKFAQQFEGITVNELQVSEAEMAAAAGLLKEDLKLALRTAAKNIEIVHRAQLLPKEPVETMPGIRCWQKTVAIEKVGLYIPGGSAPLFSTVLMLGIPAKIAGCREVVLCTPANREEKVHPAILYAAQLCGITQIFKTGGAQAIAALAFGTESIPAVYKIFGPGNQYVTAAKEQVQLSGVAIDMPAGPSEVLIVADEQCNPAFVAADLLAQAEHGADSQVVLAAVNETIVQQVNVELEKQIRLLPRAELAARSVENGFAVVLNNLDDCIAFSNTYAPEHLILACANAEQQAESVTNAGSVFLGNYSCESVGDYASGPNHTLPTNGLARSFSGVSVNSFTKTISFQQISAAGLQNIAGTVALMAEAEGLEAHRQSVLIRVQQKTEQ